MAMTDTTLTMMLAELLATRDTRIAGIIADYLEDRGADHAIVSAWRDVYVGSSAVMGLTPGSIIIVQ